MQLNGCVVTEIKTLQYYVQTCVCVFWLFCLYVDMGFFPLCLVCCASIISDYNNVRVKRLIKKIIDALTIPILGTLQSFNSSVRTLVGIENHATNFSSDWFT